MAKKKKVKYKTDLMTISATPFLSQPQYVSASVTRASGVLPARPDITFTDMTVSVDSMTDYTFQDIGGMEMLNILRTTSIKNPLVQKDNMIKNIEGINKLLSPLNILSNENYVTDSQIDILAYVPNPEISFDETLDGIKIDIIQPVEMNSNGAITINLININDEFVEYQIADSISKDMF